MFDLDNKATQAEFAELVGASQPAIHKHVISGTLKPGATFRQWLQAYTVKLRDEAAGRVVTDQRAELDRAKTREALANAQSKELALYREYQLILEKSQVMEAMSAWIALAKSEYTNSIEKILAMLESRHNITIERTDIDGITDAAMRTIGDFQIESDEHG